jgi:hypothetical protein
MHTQADDTTSPVPIPPHAHAHTHARTHTHTHAHMHTRTRTNIHTCTRTCTHTRSRSHRESLAELHSILTNDQSSSGGSTPVPRDDNDNDNGDARTICPERRRLLPTRRTRSSTFSLASQYSLASPSSPERTSFQARRKRAAKLTHFFGVDYRLPRSHR